MEHGNVDPDEIKYGDISNLDDGKAAHNLWCPMTPYSKEQREYCRIKYEMRVDQTR